MVKPRGKHSAPSPEPQKRPTIRKPDETRTVSQWLDAGLLISLLLISMALSAGVLQTQFYRIMPEAGQAGVRALVSALFYLFIAMALSYIAYRHHESFAKRYRLSSSCDSEERDVKTHLKNFLSAALLVTLLLIATRTLALAWTAATSFFGWQVSQQHGLIELFGDSTIGIIFSFINVIIVAPFVEELIFRGVLQEWLGSKMPIFFAAFLSALAFSLYHLSLWALVPNLLLGLACGYLAYKRTTLIPAIVLHMLYNATLFAAVLVLRA